MTENELRKELLEDVKQVEAPTFKEPQEQEQPQEEPQEQQQQQEQVNINFFEFGGIVTNLYCGLSDTIYKKVKKTAAAPEWSPELKAELKNAVEAYFKTVNIAVKPIYGLIATIATAEIMRYSGLIQPKQVEFNELT